MRKFHHNVESISIDYAIMEKCKNGKVVKYDGYWKDIGSFKSLYEHLEKDINSNVVCENVKTLETRNSIIMSDGNLNINVFGLEDMIIVQNGDNIVITKMEHSQNIKLFCE